MIIICVHTLLAARISTASFVPSLDRVATRSAVIRRPVADRDRARARDRSAALEWPELVDSNIYPVLSVFYTEQLSMGRLQE
jgi:hypothetical protein